MNIALLIAGGSGARMHQNIPKQFLTVNERPVIVYTLEAFQNHPEIMGSREKNTYNIYTRDLAEKIPGSVWFNTFKEMADYTMSHAKPGDLVITLGCGDVYKCAYIMAGID